MRGEVMRIADQNGLAESRHADRVAGGSITEIEVEIVAAVKYVAGHNRIAAQLQVQARHPIEVVRMRGQCALNSALFHAGTRRIVIQKRAKGSWAAGRNRIWPKPLQ